MRKLTDEQKIEIVKEYVENDVTCSFLARKYNVTPPAIISILRVRNISIRNDMSTLKRKYPINENYFDKIDTEDKAYFLGLLYADGYNSEGIAGASIGLQESDRDILEKFIFYLEYIGKPLSINVPKNPIHKNICVLRIHSEKIAKQLAKLGCTKRKSLVLKFPTEEQVPKHLLRHFVRGHFDGDGSISSGIANNTSKSFVLSLCIVSTFEYCTSELEYISNEIDINFTFRKCDNSESNSYRIDSGGNQQVFKFLEWLYKDSTIYLDRKYNKYLEIKQELINRNLIKESNSEIKVC